MTLEQKINKKGLTTIIEKNADGMLVVDQEGIVLFVNPAAEKILDRKSIELMGNMIGMPIFSGKSTEIIVNRRDGNLATAEARVVEIVWNEKDVFLISLRDISELKQMQRDILEANTKLESRVNERTTILNRTNKKLQITNSKLKKKSYTLFLKQKEVELANVYKTQFLANMSHELRTSLNSLLIYAQFLADNKEGNLTEKQIKFSSRIHSSGVELLELINDILDLSKIEAGKIDLIIENFRPCDLSEYVRYAFLPLADEKKLEFNVLIEDNLPKIIRTDRQKLFQILKNLVSNAIKFTEQGDIIVRIFRPDSIPQRFASLKPDQTLAISVSDSGIGIPLHKQKMVFEAFRQEDGTTSRKYGGTGLGLSISCQLADLLKGGIHLQSEPHKGSTFTLYLPIDFQEIENRPVADTTPALQEDEIVESLTDSLMPAKAQDEPLPIEDDRNDLLAEEKSILIVDDDPECANFLIDLVHEKLFKALLANNGEDGLQMATAYLPSAIILEINLPEMNGLEVLSRLKSNPKTCPIPVYILSDFNAKRMVLKMGAIGFLTKPVRLGDFRQVLAEIDNRIRSTPKPILIVENGKQRSPQSFPIEYNQKEILNNKNLLVVDDDMKNVFVLMSLLKKYNINVQAAVNALEAQSLLESNPKTDLVLINTMMPVLNGYDAITNIRQQKHWNQMPIIAMTAKNMKGDRQKYLDTGVSDFLSKPIDHKKLLLMLGVWLG